MNKRIIHAVFVAAGLMTLATEAGAQQGKPAAAPAFVIPVSNGDVAMSLKGKLLQKAGIAAQLPALLGLSAQHTFSKVRETTDQLGYTHLSFQQYYQGVLIDNAIVMVHFKKDEPDYINGKVAPLGNLSVTPSLSTAEAARLVKQDADVARTIKEYAPQLVIVGLNTGKMKEYVLAYKLRVDGKMKDRSLLMKNYFIDAQNGKILKKVNLIAHTDVNATANTYYSGSRPIIADSVAVGSYRLRDAGRKIETYDAGSLDQDMSGNFIGERDYWNTNTNWDLFDAFSATELQTASSTMLSNLGPGNGNILLFTLGMGSDTVIESPRFVNVSGASSLPAANGGFYSILSPGHDYMGAYLKLDFFNGTIEDTAVYPVTNITPGTYNWNDGNGNSGTYTIARKKNPGLDAHWGMEKTHDYYSSVFSRNSYDNNGSVVKNYVNSGDPYNASAAPEPYNVMFYGLGDGEIMDPVVGLDVMGHEFTHMVTEHNGNGGLDYEGESGALNESFSDIFGTNIEFYAKGADANWTIGEGIMLSGGASFFRSMANPKLKQNPDTYEGTFWVDPTDPEDNGGVHTNSGVQNKWYYLLVEGGSGTNDKGNSYTVSGIGREKAEKIAYRSLTTYIQPSSVYMDAYRYSLKAAGDLYDTTGAEYKAVKDAWYAVGIGTKDSTTGIGEIAIGANDLVLYPNPASNRITIASSLKEPLEAQVMNVVGVPVMNLTVTKGLNPVDISKLAKGVYMIRYNNNAKGYVQKLTVF